MGVEKKIFESLAIYCLFGPAHEAPRVVWSYISQFIFLLSYRYFKLKMLTMGYVVFKKFVKNVKLLTEDTRRMKHDDRQRPMEIGHMSDSGDLKILHLVL